jgi:quercetin dioxygenase-like cupin family protein
MNGVSVRWLIGPAERAPNFALRYFEIAPGGWTSLDQHAHDHGVVILRGQGQVLLGQEGHKVSFGDVIYIPGNEVHQITNAGGEPLGFLCIIPPKENGE